MKKYERFAECMRRILSEQDISATELAREVGFKSRNSLFRILNDQTSAEVEAAFLKTLKEKKCLNLNELQWRELDVALEISRVGYSDYCSNQAIRTLMSDAETTTGEGFVCMTWNDEGKRRVKPFSQMLQSYAKCKKVEMTIWGCCLLEFCRAIAAANAIRENCCEFSVTHYMFAGSDEIVQNIVAIQPLLYAPWYTAYLIEPDSCSTEAEALLRINIMIAHTVDAEGKERFEQFTMLDRRHMSFIEISNGRSVHFFKELIAYSKPTVQPVKKKFDYIRHEPQDYLRYTEQYQALEKGRSIYSVKPDVPINFIHPDILLPSVIDGFTQKEFAPKEQLEPLVEKLYEVQMLRWKNFFTKKKVTHIIFSYKAMERFTRTGRQTDHFFAMRPYTPGERKAILTHLREQAVSNPYFWIYFLKDENSVQQAEITLYEGLGVMFTKANTEYNLDADHAEAMITHPEMARKFKSFFMQDLLENHVLSYQKTIAAMDSLLYLLG